MPGDDGCAAASVANFNEGGGTASDRGLAWARDQRASRWRAKATATYSAFNVVRASRARGQWPKSR
jgi:hypothetical protein